MKKYTAPIAMFAIIALCAVAAAVLLLLPWGCTTSEYAAEQWQLFRVNWENADKLKEGGSFQAVPPTRPDRATSPTRGKQPVQP